MQKTTNYQLNQWEPSDPIRREDFNADNAAIDAAIRSAVDAAGAAQKAAEGAQKAAETSYMVGSYTGNGVELADGGQFIELGFRPRFVIISRGWADYGAYVKSTFFLTEHQVSGAERYGTLNDTGFTVGLYSAGVMPINLNEAQTDYSFVAFR